MCGFVGIIHKDRSSVDEHLLENMAQPIAHRGPDGEGCYMNSHVGFFHKRLAIIDLETGQQPMLSENNAIVFNGEIYNYIELREKLVKKGHQFKTTSDTEVILKSYYEYGPDAVKEFNGMFAFLLHDPSNNRIIAARDHFGIKPLYYYMDKDRILFGSEIKAILAHPDVTAEYDQNSLQDYLTFQFVLGDRTLFKNIYKIKPGHLLIIDQQNFDLKQVPYWSPDFNVDTYHTEAYFINELQLLLEDAVKIQLRSDVPVGAYLSGGMDSSLITTMASRLVPAGTFSTFSGAFHEGPEFSELQYVDEVVNDSQTCSYTIHPTADDFIKYFPDLIYHLDEPVAGPGLFPQYMVSKLAGSKVKVVLGGQGGDEIFGGYARYVIAYLEQAIKGAILQTTEEGEHIVSLKTILPNLAGIKQYLPMLKQFLSTGTFDPMDRRYFHLINRMNGSTSYFTGDFLSQYNQDTIFSRFQNLFNGPNTHSYFNKMTHFDLFGSLPALLQVEDRMSMAASIESRVPLLDRRIVDLVAKMPPAMKFKGGEMKYLLKKATQHILPAKILNRTDKMGFPVPFHLWSQNEAKSFIQDTVLSSKARQRGIFDPQSIEKMITSEQPYGRQLWGVLSLELWFNQFIDNK